MSVTAVSAVRLSDSELCAAVENVLTRYRRAPGRVRRFSRRPSPYCTSAALEELDVELQDGTELALMFKDTSREAMNERARRAKPPFVHDPLREIEAYRRILAEHGLGTPVCYGAVTDDEAGRYWLFLERIVGRDLQQVGELATWQRAASWLADMHARFSGVTGRGVFAHAIRYDASYCRGWLDRARRFFRGNPAVDRELAWVAGHHDRIVDRLAALPLTFLHGEFYASNILVADDRDAPQRICVVDWEMSAIGPGLIDLAALTAGKWTPEQRASIASAYFETLRPGPWPSLEALLDDLTCCRVQLAVHWLGWFGRRLPPREHTQDWLGEAIDGIRQLGC